MPWKKVRPLTTQEIIAKAIATARGQRRGVPAISNILDVLPARLREEVMDDAHAIMLAFDFTRLVWQPIHAPTSMPEDLGWVELWWPETEAKVHVGFWSVKDLEWYDSEAASKPMRAMLEGEPTHWRSFLGPASIEDVAGED